MTPIGRCRYRSRRSAARPVAPVTHARLQDAPSQQIASRLLRSGGAGCVLLRLWTLRSSLGSSISSGTAGCPPLLNACARPIPSGSCSRRLAIATSWAWSKDQSTSAGGATMRSSVTRPLPPTATRWSCIPDTVAKGLAVLLSWRSRRRRSGKGARGCSCSSTTDGRWRKGCVLRFARLPAPRRTRGWSPLERVDCAVEMTLAQLCTGWCLRHREPRHVR
jgi:hypothetical protein